MVEKLEKILVGKIWDVKIQRLVNLISMACSSVNIVFQGL